jgi:hypothetical protein
MSRDDIPRAHVGVLPLDGCANVSEGFAIVLRDRDVRFLGS